MMYKNNDLNQIVEEIKIVRTFFESVKDFLVSVKLFK